MARSYTVAVAALAIGADAKWVDNVLSRHALPGIDRSVQGRDRRIGIEGLVALLLVRVLMEGLEVPARRAVELTWAGDGSPIGLDAGVTLRLDRDEARRVLEARLPDAVEQAVRPRRGRPPRAR